MLSSERGVEYETWTAEFTNGKSEEEAVRKESIMEDGPNGQEI